MVALRKRIAVFALLGACCATPAVADELQEGPSELPGQADAQLVSPLALWPACSTPERLARVESICFSLDPVPVGFDLMNGFLGHIRSTEGDVQRMCDVDTRIVRSLQDCFSSNPATSKAMAPASFYDGFVVTMAQAWRKLGELRRADELYQYYFEGFADSQPYEAHFKEWASTKLALGEWTAAKDLARRYVAYERDLYECGRSFLLSYVKALEFQVDILETADDTEQAAEARKELERYAGIADAQCFGGSCYGCIEGICRGSPGFAASCSRHVTGKGKE